MIRIRQAEGRRVRDETGQPIGSKIIIVANSHYWQRRLADGDVVAAPTISKNLS